MKTRKKQVKALKMYASEYALDDPICVHLHNSNRWDKVIPVAVLRIDDPEALVEQVVKAIAEQPFARDQYADARAVLESLGVLPKNRAKKGTK